MSAWRHIFGGCVSDRSLEAATRAPRRQHKVRFGVPLTEGLKGDGLPIPLVDMLVYIAQEGVTTTDLFRRPGNPNDSKLIMKRLAEGKEVVFTNYNFYTLASVLKKFLLKIPGGIFGEEVEKQLLAVLDIDNRVEQYDEIHRIITSLPAVAQQLLALLFGTWFRIVNHSEYNTMSSEAVAKSVAGSLFHTCSDDPQKIERAVQVLIILIDDFGVANMFGRKNLQYFADVTRTGIRVKEKFRYEYQYPTEGSVPSISEAEFYDRSRLRSDTHDSQGSTVELRSSPPSPQSLQPQPTYKNTDADNNPHKKLQHMNSLSAPEVNKGYSPTQESSPNKRIYQSSSLSRFDNVRRRQIMRMKKRSNWFLGPNTTVSLGSSRETSVGKSSLATSSEALMSDVTASDGGMSDTPVRRRCSSDVECSYLEEQEQRMAMTTTTPITLDTRHLHPSYQPHHYNAHHQRAARLLQQPDVINGNHGNSSSTSHLSVTSSPHHSMSPSPLHLDPALSEKDVRYFMVENWYGKPTSTSTPKTTS